MNENDNQEEFEQINLSEEGDEDNHKTDTNLNENKKNINKSNSKDNQEILKKMAIDISSIKEDGKSLFCSNLSIENELKNNNKILYNNEKKIMNNIYHNNIYNINNISNDNNEVIQKTNADNNKNSLLQKKQPNLFVSPNNINKINKNEANIESEIKVLTYIWKSKMLITGHYEFEILITKKDINKNQILTQRTIYRRFNDIEILYQGLLLYNPGCLIPKIPKKNFWTNIAYSNNKEIIEERKKQIEKFLNYISKHNYLSSNPIYLFFISDEFDRYREKIKENNTEAYSLYNIIKFCLKESYTHSKNFFLKKLSGITQNFEGEGLDIKIEISDRRLRDEKLRLEKIINGTEKFIDSLKEEIDSMNNKINSMKNLHQISNILKDSNFRVEIDQNTIDEKFMKHKNFFNNESLCYLKMSENYEKYVKIINDIRNGLIRYKNVTEELIEIFVRKEKAEFELNREKNEDFKIGDKNEELKEMAQQVHQIEIQFYEELSNYHKNIENLFSVYANKYIDIKNKTDKENQIILQNNKQFVTPSVLDCVTNMTNLEDNNKM